MYLVILIILIIIILYFYLLDKNEIESQLIEIREISKKLQEETFNKIKLEKAVGNLNEEVDYLKKGIQEKDIFFHNLKSNKDDTIANITSLYADFLLIQYDISSRYLRTKKHPAKEEAKRIEELKAESKIHLEKFRGMMYKYEMLLQIFPELVNYVDDFETIKQLEEISDLKGLQDGFDRVQLYLSKEEYNKLSIDERNQLALDRYLKGQKSKWQIGRDYELYCRQNYEKDGYEVKYIGMEEKLNDMGRDLIAIKGDTHYVIQCKYWSKGKIIHEKHITQLFGTTIEYGMDLPEKTIVKPVFITNIELSESARKFAKKLGVIVKENNPLKDFPRIKCNINKDEYGFESYIYHLPFDQQYDRTKINKYGEFFAFTVKQASEAGYRRAYKHFG